MSSSDRGRDNAPGTQRDTKIAELEQQNGLAFTLAHAQWLRTQRMLFWESGTYFTLLTVSTVNHISVGLQDILLYSYRGFPILDT